MAGQASVPAAAPVRIGCSGWIYKHWRGLFYPQKLSVKRCFEFYADELHTVETASFCAHDTPGSQSPRIAVGPSAYLRFHGGISKCYGRYEKESAMNRASAPLLLLLAGCASARFTPLEGMPAAIGETVRVGSLSATPRAVVEDSRCPQGVRCIQAGRLVVSTRLDGAGWSETVPLALGEPYAVQGTTVTLVSGRPEKYSERRRPRSEYRFIYAGG